MIMKLGKRGDATIIATVILILGAIAVAVIVTTFSKQTEEKVSEKIVKLGEGVDCENVRLSVEDFEEPDKFTLRNRGTLGLDKMVVRIYEADRVDPVAKSFTDSGISCEDGAISSDGKFLPQKKCIVTFPGYQPEKIELIPFIKTENEEIGCEDRISRWEK